MTVVFAGRRSLFVVRRSSFGADGPRLAAYDGLVRKDAGTTDDELRRTLGDASGVSRWPPWVLVKSCWQ
jgi:hypothetical protein